ncbi:MAG TPA: RAMP superfamily CRISPR-associated protein, partial [Planctomycetaceae bacterium]|nr:RAMP superfamily CRISPR-associated protein [Planctomycetaceae bacterium]
SPRVYRTALRMMKEYSARNGKKVKKEFSTPPRKQQQESANKWSRKPLPSDFILRHEAAVEIKTGDLFYALIDETQGTQQVRGLYPIAIPRLTHQESRGDLLARKLYPCGRHHEICDECSNLSIGGDGTVDLCANCKSVVERLCPACRVFGWTRDLTQIRRDVRKKLLSNSDRVDAIAGHVRFTHGVLAGTWGSNGKMAAKKLLSILSSPNPTATGFYLDAADNWETNKATRWPPVTGISERNPMANLPVYRRVEAGIKGRKLYRRQSEACSNPANVRSSDQNQTVHLLPPNITFNFRVYFDNLTDRELGGLVTALSLQGLSKDIDPLFHAIGHGKPLGLGRCSIRCQVVLNTEDRYSANSFTGVTAPGTPANVDATAKVATFTNEWQSSAVSSETHQMQSNLLDMLSEIPSGLNVRYPPVDVDHNGQNADFSWWIAAKQNRTTLPDPVEERADETKRLKL